MILSCYFMVLELHIICSYRTKLISKPIQNHLSGMEFFFLNEVMISYKIHVETLYRFCSVLSCISNNSVVHATAETALRSEVICLTFTGHKLQQCNNVQVAKPCTV
jgi:hypothetical protein